MSDDTYLSTKDPIDMDLRELFNDVDLVHSKTPLEEIQKEK